MERILRSSSGMTLLAVTVAAIVGAISMMATLKMINSIGKAERGLASNLDQSEIVHTIRLLVENKAVCEQSGLVGTHVAKLLSSGEIPKTVPVVLKMGGGAKTYKAGMQFGTRTVSELSLVSLTSLGISNEYMAQLRVSTKIIGRALTSRSPKAEINVPVTLDASKRIVSCGSGVSSSVAGPATTIARHSFSLTPPACPAGWDKLWEGYSFAGAGASFEMVNMDLGTSGSCLEVFNPLPIITCEDSDGSCDISAHAELSAWLTTETVDKGGISGLANVQQKIGRCSVCSKSAPVVVRHSMTNNIPSCPSGWTSLWSGYSFGGGTVHELAWTHSLESPGSCLEVFKPMPFIECNTLIARPDDCEYWTPYDRALWITGYFYSGDTNDLKGAALLDKVSRCNVCTK